MDRAALIRSYERPGKPLRSVDCHEEWLPLLDDVRGKLRRVAGPDVPHRVNGFGRDYQPLAGADPCRWLAVDLVLQRSFENVDDFFTRVLVTKERRVRTESTRSWMTSRPGTLRSCSWISARVSPRACGVVVLM